MGEWMSTLTPHLSSTHRWKDHYKGKEILVPIRLGNPFAQNEVLLLLSALSYSLMHGLRTHIRQQRSTDSQVRRPSHGLVAQGIGRLLDPIVCKAALISRRGQEQLPHQLLGRRVDDLLGLLRDHFEQRSFELVSHAAGRPDHDLRVRRQLIHVGYEPVDDVFGHSQLRNCHRVPRPGVSLVVVSNLFLVIEPVEELVDEKWIAPGSLVDQSGQWSDTIVGPEGVGKELHHMVEA